MRVPPSLAYSAVTPASRLFTSSTKAGGHDHPRPTMTPILSIMPPSKLGFGSPSDHPQMRVLERVGILQTIAQHSIKARVGQNDHSGELQERASHQSADDVGGDGDRFVMDEIVGHGPDAGTGKIPDHAD